MGSVKKLSGIALASAASTLLLAACGGDKASSDKSATAEKPAAAPAATVAEIKCSGTNSCKGTSECATATSGCKGQKQ